MSSVPLRSVLLPTVAVLTAMLAGCGGCGSHAGDDTNPDTATPDSPLDAPDDAPTDAPDMSTIVQCPNPVPAPADGTCDATTGTGSGVLIRGNVLGDNVVYVDGQVLYQGSRLVCVGCDCSAAPEATDAKVVSCGGAVISPGLINAHDHLNYDNQSPLGSTAAGGTRYMHRHDWRGGVPTPANQFGTAATSNGMRWNELRQLINGTTSIAASTRADGGMRNLDLPEARDLALGFKPVDYEVFMLGDGNETFHANCTWGYVFSEFQVSLFPDVVTHTAEGINDYAHEEFRCQSTSFNGGRDFTEKNVAHIHGIGLQAVDYYNMARDHSKLIWSPRSNISLYGNTAAAQELARMGGTVALGTDWTYSGSATIVREMACVAQLDPALGSFFSDEDIWKMATRNAAIATGTDGQIGTLTPGKVADISVFRADPGKLHRAVIDATTKDVALVVKAGDVMYGESDVVSALGQTCDPLTVCGQSRAVCASREFGAGGDWATIAAAVSGGANPAYPAIFCPGDPVPLEPTCVPSRPGEYSAPTVMDPDGDGIIAGDNCPDTFNPIRPIDGGVQPDSDGDGLGDACDPTPLSADLDSDTVANTPDDCPFTSDTTQVDTDGDGKGDACDPCPMRANPDGVCTPAASTIPMIQGGPVTVNTSVYVEGAVVTAIDSKGFMAQDPTVADGVNAGIYVFMNGAPGVAIGDRVNFAGTVAEYFMNTEIDGAVVLAHTAGAPLAPIPLTVAQAATEPYEGVFVTLTDVTKVDYPYVCSVDNPACADARLYELNDSIIAWDDFYGDGQASWLSEATAASTDMTPTVTGVMFYRFDRRRIGPRNAGDITP